MARVEMRFDVPPEQAFEVLCHPRRYGYWVSGAREVNEYDESWPAPGSSFRHTQGIPPLTISDTTSVIACERPRRLELEARLRPLLVARIVIELEPDGDGTIVSLEETPTGGLLELPAKLPPAPQLVQARNKDSLRRLRELARSS